MLARSIRLGDVDSVRSSLAAGADPNERKGRRVPLAVAAENNRVEIAELLVATGADVGWTADDGWSALTYADANEFDALADRLVELGAPVGSRLAHGYTQLHRAARRGDAEAIAALVRSIGTETPDAHGDTALMLAVQFRHESCVDALLQAGANPNHVNDEWSLLTEAAYADSTREQSTRFAERLIAAGANPNPPGYPPLFCTVNQEGSSGAVIRRLVDAGADIAAVAGWEKETVLHRIACIADVDDVDLIDLLLELGADIEALDGSGRTPLLSAAHSGNAPSFARLLERGANPAATDSRGRSAQDLIDDRDLEAGEIRELIVRSRPG
ncbi:MAG: ankyrin repeat domain-containing protein [Ilumatobacteraceae bacterium]